MKQKTKLALAVVLTVIIVATSVEYLEPAVVNLTRQYVDASAVGELVLEDGTSIPIPDTLTIISQTGSGNGITSTYGATITRINTNLYMTPIFNGPIASYTLSGGTFSIYVNNYNNGAMSTLVYSASMGLSSLHPDLNSGSPVIIASATTYTSNAPFTSQYLTSGKTYILRDIVSGLQISGTFTDGQSFGPYYISSAEIDWVFKYQ
jgi:hypothetical protein